MQFKYLCSILFVGLLLGAEVSGEVLETVPAERLQMPLEYQVDGVVEARRQATLSAEVAGKIEAVYFDVGDFVKQGEIVLEIRDREYQAGVQQARAARDEAIAGLQEARLEFKRSEDLRKQGLISQALYDKARASFKSAEARKIAADANLQRAEEMLGYTVVRAPYSGVVVERHVEPGEATSPGKPIMTGYAVGELRVSANVPQSLIGSLRERRAVRVVLLDGGQSIEVTRIIIHPFANPRNHSFPVRLELPQLDLALYPGMLVKVALGVGETERLLVPQPALVSRAEVNAVYVVDADGRISMRQVRPGNHYGDSIEILAGLEAGESVAVDPVRAGIAHKRQLAAAQ